MAIINDSRQRASGLVAKVQSLVDRVVSSDTCHQFYNYVTKFATEKPLLATFLALQLLFSLTPILLFLSFVTGTILLSLVCATILSLFWIGVALFIFVPTLFITLSLGILAWMWAVGSFLVAKWLYATVLVSVKGKARMEMPNGNLMVVEKTGKGYGGVKTDGETVAS